MDRAYETTIDSEGHFDLPPELRDKHGFKNGVNVTIAEEGSRVFIETTTPAVIEHSRLDKVSARAALKKAVGFMGTDGSALKMLMEERRHGDGL